MENGTHPELLRGTNDRIYNVLWGVGAERAISCASAEARTASSTWSSYRSSMRLATGKPSLRPGIRSPRPPSPRSLRRSNPMQLACQECDRVTNEAHG